MNSRTIGQILIENKLITESQLSDGLNRQVNNDRMIGTILVEMGLIKKQDLIDCLNIQIKELNNLVYSLIQKDFIGDTNSLINFRFYEENKNELSFQTKKSWDRIKLSTKIAIIDIQHIWLIMLSHYASMLFKTLEKDIKINEIKNVLDLLINYAYEHFMIEESLLDIIKFDKSHYEQHKEFIRYFKSQIRNVHDIIDKNDPNTNNVLNEICEYLNNWILSHIAIYDTSYAIKVTQLRNRDDVLKTWTSKLKEQKMAKITKRQKALYDNVIKNE
jgi:hemerythrin-like metal-binding protein